MRVEVPRLRLLGVVLQRPELFLQVVFLHR
jgi:hypothetical protein